MLRPLAFILFGAFASLLTSALVERYVLPLVLL